MTKRFGIAVPQFILNGTVLGIVPNSLKYKPGLGEQSIVTESYGGGLVEVVYFDNAETKYSSLSVEFWSDEQNIPVIRAAKENLNNNTIIIADPRPDSDFKITFQNIALVSEYEVELKFEGKITGIEFRGSQTTSIY